MNQADLTTIQTPKPGYINIASLKPSSFTTKEQDCFGNKSHFHFYSQGKRIASFYFNLTGFNADFFLINKESTQYEFGKDRSLTQQMRTLQGSAQRGLHIH